MKYVFVLDLIHNSLVTWIWVLFKFKLVTPDVIFKEPVVKLVLPVTFIVEFPVTVSLFVLVVLFDVVLFSFIVLQFIVIVPLTVSVLLPEVYWYVFPEVYVLELFKLCILIDPFVTTNLSPSALSVILPWT